MWNRCSPTNSKKLLIDSTQRGDNVHTASSTKISLAMEIHIQNKCVSAQRITLEGAEPPWFQGPLKAAFLGATGVGKTSVLQVSQRFSNNLNFITCYTMKYTVNSQDILIRKAFIRFIRVQQFFKHEFPKRHVCTSRRNVYRSCLVCDTCVRELMVFDVPPQVTRLNNFRKLHEW